MWFKRHKKSDQDHALSESLKSLQSLLSETGRREPSLDPREAPPEDADSERSAERSAGPLSPRPADAASGAGHTTEPGAAPSGESGLPESSGNRWRDLNLSFDAEPILPSARRGDKSGAEDRSTDTEPVVDPVVGPEAGVRPPEPGGDRSDPAESSVPDEPAPPQAETAAEGPDISTPDDRMDPREDKALPQHPERTDPDIPEIGADAPSRPEASATGEDDVADDHEWSRQDDEVLVLDLEDPEPQPAAAPGTTADEAVDAGHPATVDASPEATVAAAAGSVAASPPDEMAEDQLHLELEPDDMSDADIPVLTDAVFVPDEPREHPAPEAFTPPGPAESPYAESISRCIDNLRVRFQLTGLDALSTEQEKELHDALVELLDELRHD